MVCDVPGDRGHATPDQPAVPVVSLSQEGDAPAPLPPQENDSNVGCVLKFYDAELFLTPPRSQSPKFVLWLPPYGTRTPS